MKWKGGRESRNVVDRRRSRAATGGGLGLGALALVVIGMFLGVDLTGMVGLSGNNPAIQSSGGQVSAADEERAEFASVVLGYTEEIWADIFREQVGQQYVPPKLVLFSGRTSSACGAASAATGPFYCPADRMAYLDTDFFVTLNKRMGAGGDFAAAYVIAHEIAHHVQNQQGILGEATTIRRQVSERDSNNISVRIELQADCYSGVWTRYAHERYGILERGDIEEALNAAAQIGDDKLQRQSTGVVRPDSFTHGSSAQRVRWFRRGLDTGNLNACNTFATDQL